MNPATIRLVLLVSCAHAMVHVYELSLPSIEQEITAEYGGGKQLSGIMGTCWRLPWGLGALAAGWLVDRFGGRPLLIIFLFGCSAMCILAALVKPLPLLFVSMFGMGTLASIYHPSGLALISHATKADSLPRVLGIHGVFGSAGIGGAPFLAGLLLSAGFSWRNYYIILALPGTLLGMVFLYSVIRQPRASSRDMADVTSAEDNQPDWNSFFTLTGIFVLTGTIYAAFLHFLPRYLEDADVHLLAFSGPGSSKYYAGLVLLVGCLGQLLGAFFARPRILERQLMLIFLANVPCLLWMALATGTTRLAACALFALVHFMHQPIYNSLIAKYTPPHRRSLCYGFNFAVGMGMGGVGTMLAGFSPSEQVTYMGLAVVAILGVLVGLRLCQLNPVSSQTT